MIRALIIIASSLVGMFAGFALTFWLVAATEHCPPQVRTCDVGPLAGAAIGMLVAPVTGVFAGWLATRYTRPRAASTTGPV